MMLVDFKVNHLRIDATHIKCGKDYCWPAPYVVMHKFDLPAVSTPLLVELQKQIISGFFLLPDSASMVALDGTDDIRICFPLHGGRHFLIMPTYDNFIFNSQMRLKSVNQSLAVMLQPDPISGSAIPFTTSGGLILIQKRQYHPPLKRGSTWSIGTFSPGKQEV